jgi:hypothetical protein
LKPLVGTDVNPSLQPRLLCTIRRPEPAVRDTDQEGLRLRRVLPCDQQQRLDASAGRAGSAPGTGHVLTWILGDELSVVPL